MNVVRPYINSFWKEDLINMNQKQNIKYAVDYTNAQPTYTRNKIRIELSQKTLKQKISLYKWFKICNKILKKKNLKVDHLFSKWQYKNFELNFWRKSIYKEELIFKFIYKDGLDIKLSKNKIENIMLFLKGDTQSKKYKLNDHFVILKEKQQIRIINVV